MANLQSFCYLLKRTTSEAAKGWRPQLAELVEGAQAEGLERKVTRLKGGRNATELNL